MTTAAPLHSPSLIFSQTQSTHSFSTPDHKLHPQSSSSPSWSNNLPKTPSKQPHHHNHDSKKSASKVSHVICKFYKAGNCSAGTACQFSHVLPELGQGKPICQWFVKGNCRFAQKCALAHILPGQPMSMDRKNKRAAQAAAREAAAPTGTPAASNPQASLSSPSKLLFPSIAQPIIHQSPSADPLLDYHHHQPHDLLHSNHSQLIPISSHPPPPPLPPPHSSSHPYPQPLPHQFNNEDHLHHHINDELEFGLPDDFTNHHLHNFGSHPHHPHPFSVSLSSPIHNTDVLTSSRPVSPDHARLPISINRTASSSWAAATRDQSPSPFGAGSPFSAPGSRSLFLPRPGSFSSSEDGGFLSHHPLRSAASAGTSPRHHQTTFLNSHSHSREEAMLWNEDLRNLNNHHHHHHDDDDDDDDEDITGFLPSSLHSLLTPQERHRQHLRKHTHDLFSKSVPTHNNPTTLSVRLQPPPALTLVHQRETSASTIRPSAANLSASSSYAPPSPLSQQYTNSLCPPELTIHAPGTSLPQGLAAGLSRLHFQPPVPTGLTPASSPDSSAAELSQRIPSRPLPFSSSGAPLQASPLSRNVSFGMPGGSLIDDEDDRVLLTQRDVGAAVKWRQLARPNGISRRDDLHDDDDAPFELEI